MTELLFRDVEVEGRAGLDVRVAGGRITEIGLGLRGRGEVIEGRGGALLPGLHDHHIHLFGLAAQLTSIDVTDCATVADFEARVRVGVIGPDGWKRVTGYHEALFGPLDRLRLDGLSPDVPARVQHQTGALWVLNSAALRTLPPGDDPAGLDRQTGWLWRADDWLRERLGPSAPPPLAPVGERLAALGVTGVTDATPTTDDATVRLLVEARQRGELPQRLRLMSAGPLASPRDRAISIGEVKILLDDHDLPDLEVFLARIGEARTWGRGVAVHCVTAAELALTLAAFETAGARAGDRIEHGGIIPDGALAAIRKLGLTVVTQPGFVWARGDRYLQEMASEDRGDAWRLGSLLEAGVAVAIGSDAPYGPLDPWRGVAAASSRRTGSGRMFGARERVEARQALDLCLAALKAPGAGPRRVEVGAAADLILLDAPRSQSLESPSAARVQVTTVDGRLIWRRGNR